MRGLALYYLRNIYGLAFLADAVDRPETDPDDEVNTALLTEVQPKGRWIKPAYRIKPPFCNDQYTHKFVDAWYAERRYAIGTYGSIVVQLPSAEAKEPKISPNGFHQCVGWCFAQGAVTDATILIFLLLGWLLPWWGLEWAGIIYPMAFLVAIVVLGCLWYTRGAHVLKAVVPRLAACTIVGLVPPLATQEAWKFSFRLWDHQYWFWGLIGIVLLASWLYLFVETHNHVGKNRLSGRRAFHILLRLCNFALFFSWWGTALISTIVPISAIVPSLVQKEFEQFSVAPRVLVFSLVELTTPLPTCVLFAAFAVFIGIFLQILWHERPITSRI